MEWPSDSVFFIQKATGFSMPKSGILHATKPSIFERTSGLHLYNHKLTQTMVYGAVYGIYTIFVYLVTFFILFFHLVFSSRNGYT